MKKLFLFLAFFGCVALTANAQTCTKSASAKKSCCAKTTAANAKAAATLASLDANIEQKTCELTGKVSYEKSYTCSVSGKTTTTAVTYDAATKKFVNVSPSKMSAENASGGQNVKKAATTKKSCTKGAASCSKKTTSVSTKKSCDPAACSKKASNVKLVKAEN